MTLKEISVLKRCEDEDEDEDEYSLSLSRTWELKKSWCGEKEKDERRIAGGH